MACTSRMCRPQNSAICSKESAVLSTSQVAVACGISGLGWAIVKTPVKLEGPPFSGRPLQGPDRGLCALRQASGGQGDRNCLVPGFTGDQTRQKIGRAHV